MVCAIEGSINHFDIGSDNRLEYRYLAIMEMSFVLIQKKRMFQRIEEEFFLSLFSYVIFLINTLVTCVTHVL